MTLEEIEDQIARFDALLEPIARRPVDRTGSQEGDARPHPLDEAGIKDEAEATARAVVDEYVRGDDEVRAALRQIYERHRYFRWAAYVPRDSTPDGFRTAIVQLAVRDHAMDPRDSLLAIQHECGAARQAGIDPAPILREVAAMSSDVDRYGVGSMRRILLGQAAAEERR